MTHDEMIAVIQAHLEGKIVVRYESYEDDEHVKIDTGHQFNFYKYWYEAQEEPKKEPKFKEGDTVRIKGVVPIGVVTRYEGSMPVVDYGAGEVAYQEDKLELFKPLTREEITAKWVKDNDVKIGDFVKINHIGANFNIFEILSEKIIVDLNGYKDLFDVESLKKVTKRIEKFTFEDRELFRDKWVVSKGGIKAEQKIWSICDQGITLLISGHKFRNFTFEEALEELEFIDGTPFGKEVWE